MTAKDTTVEQKPFAKGDKVKLTMSDSLLEYLRSYYTSDEVEAMSVTTGEVVAVIGGSQYPYEVTFVLPHCEVTAECLARDELAAA